jgi:hypothetical protein
MSLLINDELIWVSTPKSASTSIFNALKNSKLNLKKVNGWTWNQNAHLNLDTLKKEFGNKESICITRDWFDKWISSLNYIWDVIEYMTPFEPICKWEELDNKFIYELFNTTYINTLHMCTNEALLNCLHKIILNPNNYTINEYENWFRMMGLLISEKYYKSNKRCTYEFDIKDIDKFINFIENKFGEKLVLENTNKSTKRENKIIINDELKSFVWEKFEKRFEKRNILI